MKLIILAFILSLIIHFLPIGKELLKNKPTNNLKYSSKDIDKNSKSKVRYVKLSSKVEQIQKIEKKSRKTYNKNNSERSYS